MNNGKDVKMMVKTLTELSVVIIVDYQ